MYFSEYRTEQSRQEIELLESLEDLKELNRRQQSVDYESMLKQYKSESAEERKAREEREDNEFIKYEHLFSLRILMSFVFTIEAKSIVFIQSNVNFLINILLLYYSNNNLKFYILMYNWIITDQ